MDKINAFKILFYFIFTYILNVEGGSSEPQELSCICPWNKQNNNHGCPSMHSKVEYNIHCSPLASQIKADRMYHKVYS